MLFFKGFFCQVTIRRPTSAFCAFKHVIYIWGRRYIGLPILPHSIVNYAHDLPHLQNYVIARQGIITGDNGV